MIPASLDFASLELAGQLEFASLNFAQFWWLSVLQMCLYGSKVVENLPLEPEVPASHHKQLACRA